MTRPVATSSNTNVAAGLTSEEAQSRLARFGPNVIDAKRISAWWIILARQFTGVLILLLFVAAGIAFAMGETIDALAIGAIVALNGCLGFVQEWRAERALEALRSMLSVDALVVRDGVEMRVDVREIVPGDRIVLHSGAKVPADIDLDEIAELRIDESALTGESVSVSKRRSADAESDPRSAQAFMGTSVVEGHATGLVMATGMQTEFGRIAELTTRIGTAKTQLQRKLGRLGQRLGLFAIVTAAVIVLIGWIGGKPVDEMILTGISLAVAVVPEGLPAVVTVTLALGARAMVRRHALSRHLQATETLGAASVICTDKTGTLTENQMTAIRVWVPGHEIEITGSGYDPSGHFVKDEERFEPNEALTKLLTAATICNHARIERRGDAWERIGEPTEAALAVAALKAGVDPSDRAAIHRELPFTSEKKRMSVLAEGADGATVYAKGAPEVILAACRQIASEAGPVKLGEAKRAEIENAYETLAGSGLRVLAAAEKRVSGLAVADAEMESDLVFLGLIGLIDPPRREVRRAIADAYSAGIDVIMITGDAPSTGLAIAKMLGMRATHAVIGTMLDEMDDAMTAECLGEGVIFARTTPSHKMRLIEVLQDQGKVIAMTGDGVNDAPALRQADIGVAMGIRGTEVARDSSDIVLLDDNFASIVSAIEEGRRQYENIKKFVRYLLSSNAGEVVAIVVSIVIGGPLIFLPIQILWMNLVTDGPTALTLGLERSEADAMSRPPRNAEDDIVGRDGLLVILLFAAYTGSASLFAFYSILDQGVLMAQTVAFTTMIFLEKCSVFAFRSLSLPTVNIGFFSNPWLHVAVILTLAAQVLAVYWPPLQRILHTEALDIDTWLMITLLVVPVLIVPEIVKIIRHRRSASTKKPRAEHLPVRGR